MKSLFTHCDLALTLFKTLFFPLCIVELSVLAASYRDVSVKYIFVRPFRLFLVSLSGVRCGRIQNHSRSVMV